MNQQNRTAGKELQEAEITHRIIGAAIRVHRALGPGFLEVVYEEGLAVEFALSGIDFVGRKTVPLFYKDHQIGELNFTSAPLTIERFCRNRWKHRQISAPEFPFLPS